MKSGDIDLHVHSDCSDGTFTPARLVEHAVQKGLRAFALTDHDTVAGLAKAFAAAGDTIEVVAGIEFSTRYQGKDVHIVGLDFDYKNPGFLEELSCFQDARRVRNEKMIAQMRADGIEISLRQMQEAYKDPVITRAHFARYLTEHGYAATMQEAFLGFLGEGCRYYVPREKAAPSQAVRLIARYGGIPVFAHPMLCGLSDANMEELLAALKDEGLIGMEVFYSTYTPREENLARALMERYGLLPSGGSDFHGSNKPSIALGRGLGNLHIPYQILDNLRARRDKR